MAIAVTCNHCGVRLRFKNEHQGRTAKCNACQQSLIVQGDTIPDHDVFISYSSKDKNVADAICAAMEAKRIRCWIAPRDILPGKQWAGAILDAIEDTRIMVLVYSASANASPQVIREVDCAVTRNVIIIPFRIEAAEMSKEMQYYIAAAHWLDAIDGPMDQHITKLVSTVRRLFNDKPSPAAKPIQPVVSSAEPSRSWIVWPIAAVVLLLAIGSGVWFFKHSRPMTQATPIVAVSTSKPAPPVTTQPGGTIDLLASTQLPDDALSGTWQRTSEGIHSDIQGNDVARLRFHYRPQGEYDFSVTFVRQSGERLVGQVLSYGGKSFSWVMGRDFNRYDGFELIGGAFAQQNRSGVQARTALVNGQKYTSVVKVRKNSVSAYLNGKLISQITTDYAELSVPKLNDIGPDFIGIVTSDSTMIYAATVTPVSDRLPSIPVASKAPASATRPQQASTEPQGQQWVDLLKLVNPSSDSLGGSWTLADGDLTARTPDGTSSNGAHIELPYQPTEEYDLRVSFICHDPDTSLGFICRGGDHQFHWTIPAGANATTFFSVVSGTRRRVLGERAQWIYPDRRHIALIKVRKDGIEAYMDEKLTCEMKTDFKNLALATGHVQPHRLSLGLEAGPGSAVFQSVQILEVSGKGTPLRQ